MAEQVSGKIRVVRDVLDDFKKRYSTFSNLDKSLKDSEIFLNIQISDLSEDFHNVKTLHSEIVANASDDDLSYVDYKNEKVFQAIKNIFFKHSTTLHEVLKIVSKTDRHDITFTDVTQGTFRKLNQNRDPSNTVYSHFDANQSYIPGSVPNFDGKYSNWPDFMDAFQCNVHENEVLTDSLKLRILQSLLKDDALKVIKREFGTLKSTSYEDIWRKLCSRYNHKRTLVYSYFNTLVFQTQLEKESAEGIKLLYDNTYDSLTSLKALEVKWEDWGDLLLFIVYSKLPLKTKEAWNEKNSSSDSLPEFKCFLEFLERRFRTLESIEASRTDINSFNNKKMSFQHPKKVTTLQTSNSQKSEAPNPNVQQQKTNCKCCSKGSHSIRKCFKFKKMKPEERLGVIISLGYCTNCLSYSHKIDRCISEGRCEQCNEKHNSLLCLNSPPFSKSKDNAIQEKHIHPSEIQSTSDGRFSQPKNIGTYTSLISASDEQQYVVFPTALVKVENSDGRSVVLRAMIDTCSDASYITVNAARNLNLQVEKADIQVCGLGGNVTSESRGTTCFQIQSLVNQTFKRGVNAYVLSAISPNRPVKSFKTSLDPNLSIQMADPYYNINAKIDLLLGGDIDSSIHMNKSFKSGNIVFRETQLGWIVSGAVPQMNCFATITTAKCEDLELVFKSLDDSIRRFWEIEEIPSCRSLTEEERLCEVIYDATTIRLPTGKYSVSLPFRREVKGFNGMRKRAVSRFSMLEKRFTKNKELHRQYSECLQEYLEMGHMTEVDPSEYPNGYYIPHHCVVKEASSTTKLRVVFDASAKDSENESLNDSIMNGPRLQPELLDHLLRFRFFKVAFTADIAKMYRQILINPNDRKFQLILWRLNPVEELKTFCLNTVTFGTTSAPYLAVKTLVRLSEDEKLSFPKGSMCLKKGFYIDDCIFGADDVNEALELQKQTRMILSAAGFHLRKWSSNSEEILNGVPEADRETKNLLEFDNHFSVKTLGVQWCPSDDCFYYKINLSNTPQITKRSVLSEISKIFDPLGWISPSVVSAKLLIQALWSEKVEWDEMLSEEYQKLWVEIRDGLSMISSRLKIPRWLQTYSTSPIEIHGFSDASQKAYAAAIYVRTPHQINLLFAKTKVAPLKNISLPRLELMAALMLTRLMNHLKELCDFKSVRFHYWSDSQITLAWIKDSPNKRAVFVANRVAEIQSLTNPSQWHYVESKKNPSDLGTRGIPAAELPGLSLWWSGPEFLRTFDENTVKNPSEIVTLPKEDNIKRKEVKSDSLIYTLLSNKRTTLHEISSNIMKFSFEPLNKFSTLSKLVRVFAYCLRFVRRNREKHIHVSPSEYDKALLTLLKVVQGEIYSDEIQDIQSVGLSKSSSLYSLNPFFNEEDNLLRITGRLGNADHLNYDQKHPIILPHSHVISKLIVMHAHLSTLHGTGQQTFLLVSQRYHIIRGKSLIKSVSSKCVKCFRFRCSTQQQLMGQLPKLRITPNRPFLNAGVDFAGPFEIKKFRGRCKSVVKAYFAIFVCFSTKAVHLEVVIDLSSAAFIACYRRFISRRGLVKNLYSDCGTNFKGAQRSITRSMAGQDNEWNEIIAKELAGFQTTWHFNPPGSPHFGGLWEAGVKSVKHHLKRVVGETRLTYDEFETVLLQVEACLNSRPLCEIKDSKDVLVLTPAHFLIQGNLLSLPDDNLSLTNISHLNRWNMLQKMVQDFWKIWNQEYLNTIRQRHKWKLRHGNLKKDDVVVIKEPNLPPNSWLLAKVIEVHPGPDGLVRVVSLKTEKRILQRPIVKLCPLPIQSE